MYIRFTRGVRRPPLSLLVPFTRPFTRGLQSGGGVCTPPSLLPSLTLSLSRSHQLATLVASESRFNFNYRAVVYGRD